MSIIDYSDGPVNGNFVSNIQTFFNEILTDYTKLFEEFINRESKNEALAECGCAYYKHDPDRQNYLNGTRKVEIKIPGFVHLEVEETRLRESPSTSGIVQDLHKAQILYRNQFCALLHSSGASLGAIETILEKLDLKPIRKSQISNVIIDYRKTDLITFNTKDFSETDYPILFVDALYEHIKVGDSVYDLACQVVYGIDREGKASLLTIYPVLSESTATYSELFDLLRQRGLSDPVLVISDAHPGIREAVGLAFPGCVHQLCSVHFIRNCLKRLPEETSRSEKSAFGKAISAVFKQASREMALEAAQQVLSTYEQIYPQASAYFKKHFMDSLNFYAFPEINPEKISSSNLIERQNEEFRRRSDSVHVFPSIESYQRILLFARQLSGQNWFDSVQIDPDGLERSIELYLKRNQRLESICSGIADDFRVYRDQTLLPVLSSQTFFEVFVTYRSFQLYEDLSQIHVGFLYAVGITDEGERVSLSLKPVLSSKKEAVKQMVEELSQFDFCPHAILCHDLTEKEIITYLKDLDLFTTIRSRERVLDSILSKILRKKDSNMDLSVQLESLFRSKTLKEFNLKLEQVLSVLENDFVEAAEILTKEAQNYQELFDLIDGVLTLRRCCSPRHFSQLLKTAADQQKKELNFFGLVTQVVGIFENMKQSSLVEFNKSAFFSGDKVRTIQDKIT